MSKRLTVTANGQHKVGKKLFYTDKNLIHRKGKKAFLTVNGVHRLVYSSGTTWHKYNCEIQYDVAYHYERSTESDKLIGTTNTRRLHYSNTLCREYGFSDRLGFVQVGQAFHFASIESVGNAAIGAYILNTPTEAQKIISIDSFEGNYYYVTYEIVDACEIFGTVTVAGYTKGSTSYGKIEVEEGTSPEAGTLIRGSVEEGRCVLEIDGTYYYYLINDIETDDNEANYSAKLDTAIIGSMKLEE